MVQIFNRRTNEVDTLVLAAVTALSIGDIIPDGIVKNFLLKNLQTFFHVSVPNVGDSWIVVLAAADASVGEIAAALANTSMDTEDQIELRDGQSDVRRVWSIHTNSMEGLAAGGSIQEMHQWKLPPKGVPVLRGHGLTMFVYNTDTANAFGNGPSFKTFSKGMGGFF